MTNQDMAKAIATLFGAMAPSSAHASRFRMRLYGGDVVDCERIERIREGGTHYSKYQIPDGRTFSWYEDRLEEWAEDNGGLLTERMVRFSC